MEPISLVSQQNIRQMILVKQFLLLRLLEDGGTPSGLTSYRKMSSSAGTTSFAAYFFFFARMWVFGAGALSADGFVKFSCSAWAARAKRAIFSSY